MPNDELLDDLGADHDDLDADHDDLDADHDDLDADHDDLDADHDDLDADHDDLDADHDALGGPEGGERAEGAIARELGLEAARALARAWDAHDRWERRNRPDEGLRERKKRITRQRISDVATALFVNRGFDAVRVSEIAAAVGVSEKTIYNYFPTKESLVYDRFDDQLATVAAALRGREPGVSPTSAIVAQLKHEAADFAASVGDERPDFLPAFGEMIQETPALRAAWGEHRHRLVELITDILATEARVDPRDPEPITAARALVSLIELLYDSMLRHIASGASAAQVRAAMDEDLDRAARLLDTGMWSLHLMVEGRRTKQQLRDAATAAEQARKEVVTALREAKRAWRTIRDEQRSGVRDQRAALRKQRAGLRDQAAALKEQRADRDT